MTQLQRWLAAQVKAGLADLDMSQAQLARETGMSEKHLSQLLNGHAVGSLLVWNNLLLYVGMLNVSCKVGG
jgi:transcriptional regulator with XRE-family HTH domain